VGELINKQAVHPEACSLLKLTVSKFGFKLLKLSSICCSSYRT